MNRIKFLLVRNMPPGSWITGPRHKSRPIWRIGIRQIGIRRLSIQRICIQRIGIRRMNIRRSAIRHLAKRLSTNWLSANPDSTNGNSSKRPDTPSASSISKNKKWGTNTLFHSLFWSNKEWNRFNQIRNRE